MPRKKKEEVTKNSSHDSPKKKINKKIIKTVSGAAREPIEKKPRGKADLGSKTLKTASAKMGGAKYKNGNSLKMKDSGEKYVTASTGGKSQKPVFKASKLPRYGQTQMVAFIRDPRCIFTYWEVTPESVEAVKKHLMGEFHNSSMVLRVFKTNTHGESELLYEIKVEPDEMNRYVNLEESGGSYYIEIGQKTSSGRYIPYARSNKVVTSQGGFSPTVDPNWEPPTGILEYFSDEIVEESFEPEKKGFSASLGKAARISKPPRGKFGHHAASHF